jgi:hypothetical protein
MKRAVQHPLAANKFLFALIVASCISAASAGSLRGGVNHARLAVADSQPTLLNLIQHQEAAQTTSKDRSGVKGSTIWIVLIILFVCCCVCPVCFLCLMCRAVGVVVEKAIENFKNEMAKNMRESFDKECPEEEKGKYTSKEFKDECDVLFKKADTDGNGTLDAKELKKTVADILGSAADSQSDLILLEFD